MEEIKKPLTPGNWIKLELLGHVVHFCQVIETSPCITVYFPAVLGNAAFHGVEAEVRHFGYSALYCASMATEEDAIAFSNYKRRAKRVTGPEQITQELLDAHALSAPVDLVKEFFTGSLQGAVSKAEYVAEKMAAGLTKEDAIAEFDGVPF